MTDVSHTFDHVSPRHYDMQDLTHDSSAASRWMHRRQSFQNTTHKTDPRNNPEQSTRVGGAVRVHLLSSRDLEDGDQDISKNNWPRGSIRVAAAARTVPTFGQKNTQTHPHKNPLREKVPLSPQLSSLMTTHPRGVAWRGGGTRTGRTLSRTRLLFYPSPSLFFFIIHISTLPSVFLHCELFIAWVRYGRGVVGRR